MIRPLHIVAIVFAIVMLALTIRNYVRRKLSLGALAGWSIVWVGVIIATLLFDALKTYTEAYQVRVFDLIVVIAFLAAFLVLFQFNGKLQQLGAKMEEIVAHIALQDVQRRKKR